MKAFAGLIGAGREDITPPVGIYARNWGAAAHDMAEGIHRPLTVTVLTFQSEPGSEPLVLVSADLGWWRTRADEWELRSHLLRHLQLDPARVMLCLTHTHAGPALCAEDADKPGGDLIAPYLTRLKEAVMGAVEKALHNAQPALLDWTTGHCGLAANRDLPDPDGNRFLSGYNAEEAADDTLLVGRLTNHNGEYLATIVNYACHPTTLAWQNRLTSPDYVGAMRELVEGETGNTPCLFLLGACGELAPREQYTADTAIADRHGRQLGYAVLSALTGMLPPGKKLRSAGVVESGAPLAVFETETAETSSVLEAVCVDVPFALQALPSLAELDAQIIAAESRFARERLSRKRRIRASLGDSETAAMPFWVWRLGDAFLVGHPNEAYSLLQTELRRKFPANLVAVMNVVNGHYGYLPPATLYTEDLYPVWQTPFAVGSLEQLLTACEQTLSHLCAGP